MAHVCEECGAAFQRPSRLQVHIRTHTGDRPFKCQCGRSYIRRQHLVRHEAKCNGTSETPEVNKTLLEKSFSSSEYFCPKCGSGPYHKKKTVWAHLAIVHGERRFRCEVCSAAFPTKSKLARHRNKHHSLECHLCTAMLKDPGLYDGEEPPAIGRFESFSKLREHIARRHPKKTFICPTCDQRFKRVAHLREHELRHSPGSELLCQRKIFVCELCSLLGAEEGNSTTGAVVSFTAKRNLAAHMRSVHSSELRKFPCIHPSCPAILSTKQKLVAHLARHDKSPSQHRLHVTQRPSFAQSRRLVPPSPRPRRRCVPLKDLQEAWETDSESSVVVSMLC